MAINEMVYFGEIYSSDAPRWCGGWIIAVYLILLKNVRRPIIICILRYNIYHYYNNIQTTDLIIVVVFVVLTVPRYLSSP
jgi:hypothetical protein